MNLIEQLGGYEQANSKLLKMDKILKEVYYSHSDAQKADELRQAIADVESCLEADKKLEGL